MVGLLHFDIDAVPKWRQTRENLKIIRMVLSRKGKCAPTFWLIGHVVRVRAGENGSVRTAYIKVAKGNRNELPAIRSHCLLNETYWTTGRIEETSTWRVSGMTTARTLSLSSINALSPVAPELVECDSDISCVVFSRGRFSRQYKPKLSAINVLCLLPLSFAYRNGNDDAVTLPALHAATSTLWIRHFAN